MQNKQKFQIHLEKKEKVSISKIKQKFQSFLAKHFFASKAIQVYIKRKKYKSIENYKTKMGGTDKIFVFGKYVKTRM